MLALTTEETTVTLQDETKSNYKNKHTSSTKNTHNIKWTQKTEARFRIKGMGGLPLAQTGPKNQKTSISVSTTIFQVNQSSWASFSLVFFINLLGSVRRGLLWSECPSLTVSNHWSQLRTLTRHGTLQTTTDDDDRHQRALLV